jgi:hypothetical protein
VEESAAAQKTDKRWAVGVEGLRLAPDEETAVVWKRPQLMSEIVADGRGVDGLEGARAGTGRTVGRRLCTSSRPHWTRNERHR